MALVIEISEGNQKGKFKEMSRGFLKGSISQHRYSLRLSFNFWPVTLNVDAESPHFAVSANLG